MALRLTYLVIGSSLLTYTTTPNKLTDAIEALLKPLEKIKVPVHDIAMMMSLAAALYPDSAGRSQPYYPCTECQRCGF